MINAILAHDDKFGIGKDGTLPWPHNTNDMKFFKEQTLGSVVIMGRRTWESLGKNLPNRTNVVLSSQRIKGCDTHIGGMNPQETIELVKGLYVDKPIWIIGGKQIYEFFLPITDRILVSKISGNYSCDTHLDFNFFNGFNSKSLNIPGLNIIEWTKIADYRNTTSMF